ncbi:MAG: BatA and WFA domain-containing protein [Chitinophagales bacterium]|nr:BatA and WFA domain-containing protein [Chitinophagales bacterium]
MQFLHPWFLWALLFLAIPVIIHLFSFRRFKTVYFSNVKFLKEVKEETASRSKLKHLLVLLSRMLALAFLVAAFAQPFIPSRKAQLSSGIKYVSIYIDNSFSMNGVSAGQSLLDKAKLAAKEIAKGYAADDRFQLLTNDFEGKHQRLVGREEFISMTDEVEPSPSVRNFSEIVKRQKEALSRENSSNKIAYLLSDFQKTTGTFEPDSGMSYNLIPLAADAQANVYIDTCWFIEPVQLLNQPLNLVVKVSNSGEKEVENNRLAFKLNGQTKTMSELKIASGSFILDTLRFTTTQAGWNRAELSVSDFPITYDDNYFIAFNVIEKIKVLSVYDARPNRFLDAMFKEQAEFDFTSVQLTSFQPEMLQENKVVLLDNLKLLPSLLTVSLNTYVSGGGTVVVFPGEKCEQENYNRFLNNLKANSITGFSEQVQDMAGINLQQNVFKDVFEKVPDNMNLPKAKKYYTFSRSAASLEETILLLKDGSSFFSRYPVQAGSLYVSASPLDKDFSELPVHAVFVPMLYKIAVLSINSGSISYFIGDKTRIEVEARKGTGDKAYRIKGDNLEFVPEQFAVGNKMLLGLNEQVRKAGFYKVSIDNAELDEVLALNFDRKESNLQFYTAGELAEKYPQQNVSVVDGARAEVAAVVKELDRGTPLWKLCIILTLLFLACEIALLRFWKV